MLLSKKIAWALDRALNPIRTGIIVEGLEVPHAHVHLIPIYKKTQPFTLSHSIEVENERMQQLAETISAEVKI